MPPHERRQLLPSGRKRLMGYRQKSVKTVERPFLKSVESQYRVFNAVLIAREFLNKNKKGECGERDTD